jgi:protein TonB
MSAPPEDDMNKIARSFAKPVPEVEQAPVVTDSVIPEKVVPKEEKPEEKPEDMAVNKDTAAVEGGSGLGTGVGTDTGIASAVDVFPRYPGGDESRLYFLRKNVRYPDGAIKALVQGVVMVVFVVEVDGSISNVSVAKRIGGGCDEEAIRVTKEMPRWEPGKRNGRAVRVMVRMPIVFRIPGKSAS